MRCCLILMAAALVIAEALDMGSVCCAYADKRDLMRCRPDMPSFAVLI